MFSGIIYLFDKSGQCLPAFMEVAHKSVETFLIRTMPSDVFFDSKLFWLFGCVSQVLMQ
jgi:hypothetical protein